MSFGASVGYMNSESEIRLSETDIGGGSGWCKHDDGSVTLVKKLPERRSLRLAANEGRSVAKQQVWHLLCVI